METANTLTVQQRTALLDTLQARFERNERLHPGIAWENVRAKLEAVDGKLRSLFAMEKTGGQPDVVAYDHAADAYVFYDCAPEARQAAGTCATTARRGRRASATSPRATSSTRPPRWASRF